jgi:hypothetical protein
LSRVRCLFSRTPSAAWHACLEHSTNSTLVHAVAEDLPQIDLDVPQQGNAELSG